MFLVLPYSSCYIMYLFLAISQAHWLPQSWKEFKTASMENVPTPRPLKDWGLVPLADRRLQRLSKGKRLPTPNYYTHPHQMIHPPTPDEHLKKYFAKVLKWINSGDFEALTKTGDHLGQRLSTEGRGLPEANF